MAVGPAPTLRGWESVVQTLVESENEGLVNLRIANFMEAVRQGGRGPGGHVWTQEVLDAVLDAVRPQVHLPIPPRLGGAPVELCVLEHEAAPSESFVWGWWDLPIPWLDEEAVQVATFPLPVATLAVAEQGTHHLMSCTALWHLLPGKMSAGDFFARRHTKLWTFLEGLSIAPEEFIPSERSRKAERRAAEGHAAVELPLVQDRGQPTFHMHMSTPKFLLGALAFMVQIPNQAEANQRTILSILRSMCSGMPDNFACAGLAVVHREVYGWELGGLLADLDCVGLWGVGVAAALGAPPLTDDGMIPLPWVLWHAFRSSRDSDLARGFSKALVHSAQESAGVSVATRLESVARLEGRRQARSCLSPLPRQKQGLWEGRGGSSEGRCVQ